MKKSNIMKLTPSIVEKIWGGERLAKLKRLSQSRVGETWEISIHADGPSLFSGKKINSFITEKEMPYLVKLIDTSDNLSVQVHPDDEYAKKNENSFGKSECWIILDAEPGEGIYLGTKNSVSKMAFADAILSGKDLSRFMKFYPVKSGDFFYVPAGSLHAIGRGIFLAEIQQNSGITYRVWDWNRLDEKGVGRDLHVDKALDVIRFDSEFNCHNNFKIRNNLFDNIGAIDLISHEQFNVRLYSGPSGNKIKIPFTNTKRHGGIMCLAGKLVVKTSIEEEQVDPFESVLINREISEDLNIEFENDGTRFIWVY